MLFTFVASGLMAQDKVMYDDVEAGQFDYGKMWTFEHAPLDYFEETYQWRPDEKWLKDVRMSSLRFASWCSASFVSPDGLIMTNHHCSRDEVGKVMKDGENFNENGFYAEKLGDERQVEGLYVKQLRKIADITSFVKDHTDKAANEMEWKMMQDSAFKMAEKKYMAMPGWEGLELETVTYYNGGKYSLYGYKRYGDIRLVMIPESQMGHFGGDPDNFTYPRYSLDFTFWRAYEDDKPVNTSEFYYPFNVEGAKDGEPVFVVGNPGTTERYRTMAQLEFDRDYSKNIIVDWLRNRMNILQGELDKEYSFDLENQVLGLSNSVKAYTGIVKGLHNPYLMGKKAAMERDIKGKSKAVAAGNDYWKQMEAEYAKLGEYRAETIFLGPSPMNGKSMALAHTIARYMQMLEGEAGEEDLTAMREQIKEASADLNSPLEAKYLGTLLGELKQYAGNDAYVTELLAGRSPQASADFMLENTRFGTDKMDKVLKMKYKKLKKLKDPMIKMAKLCFPEYMKAVQAFQSSSPLRTQLGEKIGGEIFEVFGLNIPPDATFTLRLADGVVAGYDYNGTTAPSKTTFFGMYDRHYSNNGEYPWSLPKQWKNPPAEMLGKPLNFVSTNDIIGGNSGSPIFNKNKEVVGLVFDGNIESLPGNFIYDEEVNRTVSVHAGGIVATLKYIFKADRLVKELTGK